MLYLISIILIFIISYNAFVILLYKKVNSLEYKIIKEFNKRNNLIPGLYESTYGYITKHSDVFNNILKLRKQNLSNFKNTIFIERIYNETLIHNELDFIFKVCDKNPKIDNNEKFNLIKELFLKHSSNISKYIMIHKKIIPKLNKLLYLKNLTLIGLFIKLQKKEEI